MTTPKRQTIKEVQSELLAGETTCVALVNHYLKNIHQKNQHLNAFVEVFEEEAQARAQALDEKLKTSPTAMGKLFGLVISIKDVLCYKNHIVAASSRMLENFTSTFSATAIEKLVAADAIIIGRTNCDEFAMGSTNETSYFGATRNAADTSKVPGGSSGGSAVSVQADMCMASLGSDTGGSVRQPAAWCGLVGLKPTYGRISRHGLLAYASSFDQIGIFTHHVEDAALLLEVIAGEDEFDATVAHEPVLAYSHFEENSEKKRIAYFPQAIFHEGMDENIQESTLNFIEQLKAQGHTVEAVDFDLIDYLVPTYYVLTTAEASSNLSRYDGVRYGHRTENPKNLQDLYRRSRTEGFGKEVKKRVMLGTFVLSVGYYDAYFTKAQQLRQLIVARKDEIFQAYDFIVMPTTPNFPPAIGASKQDPIATYLADIFTVFANLAGIPAVSIPITGKSHLPIGVQLIADNHQEKELLNFARKCAQKKA